VELHCPVGTRMGTGASGHVLRWKFAGRAALLSLVGYSKMRLSHGASLSGPCGQGRDGVSAPARPAEWNLIICHL
jgi:hypothetical protein